MELYEQIELQECPICGGAGLMEEENGWCFYAACLDCGAHTAELAHDAEDEVVGALGEPELFFDAVAEGRGR